MSEKEVEKIVPFATATKRIKYLGINLTKHVKDLYNENYKKSKKIQRNGKIFRVLGLEESTQFK